VRQRTPAPCAIVPRAGRRAPSVRGRTNRSRDASPLMPRGSSPVVVPTPCGDAHAV
jgi:hypothetical protein